MMQRTPLLRAQRRGFAIVEAALSALIIGLMMAAALELVAKSRSSQVLSDTRLRGYQLASMLMAEITDLPYADPTEPTVLLGPEASEILAGREAFDDVDDYNGYTEAPPRMKDGAAIAGAAGWTRTVAVSYVAPADATAGSIIDTGVKRITVTASIGGKKVAELVSIRTSSVNR
jgi:type II secretory pathway pseudopilin PulG